MKRMVNSLFLLWVVMVVNVGSCFALSKYARSKGFVYLHEVDPTIVVSLRYYTDKNFLGRRMAGYNRPVAVMIRQAAEALKKVHDDVKKDGYRLVVYDAYRPQRAVDGFVQWSMDVADQVQKAQYYPRINKADIFELGYVAKRSGHSRGSTVDLTLIRADQELHDIIEQERTLLDETTIIFLHDGTVDMGSSFDLADKASHHENDLVAEEFKVMRAYLRDAMMRNGFNDYAEEWWHFTLRNEPYPADQDASYFDFEIE